MIGRALGNRRSRLILIAAAAVAVLIALTAVVLAAQRDGAKQRATPEEPPTERPPSSLGIDLRRCPKTQPEKLPPDALAGATEAALEQVPSVFGDVEATEGAYAVAAYLAESGRGRSPMIRKGLGCSKLLQDRSIVVDLVFPKLEPSASLSQHTVFVARFGDDYWVWGIGH
jgi:hypothetical protein